MAPRALATGLIALGLATACAGSELDAWCANIWQVRTDCGGCGIPDPSDFIDACASAMLRAQMSDGAARAAFQCAGEADSCTAVRDCLAPTRLSITSDGITVHRF